MTGEKSKIALSVLLESWSWGLFCSGNGSFDFDFLFHFCWFFVFLFRFLFLHWDDFLFFVWILVEFFVHCDLGWFFFIIAETDFSNWFRLAHHRHRYGTLNISTYRPVPQTMVLCLPYTIGQPWNIALVWICLVIIHLQPLSIHVYSTPKISFSSWQLYDNKWCDLK